MRGIALLIALAAIQTGCGGDHPRDWGRADTAAMVDDTPTAVRPLPDQDAFPPDDPDSPFESPGELVLAADSAAGDLIFHRRGQCFTCHGAAGGGMARLGPSLRDGVWLHSDGSLAGIQRAVAEGVAAPRASPIAMPGFARQLSAEELFQVSAYVYAIGRPGSVLRADPDTIVGGTGTPEP
jgi:mono/diheme cytochrome c family protein